MSFNNTYSEQVAEIQSQLNKLQRPAFSQRVHKVIGVDGMSGAEAVLKEMPAGSSDIVAHKTENIAYLLARDENNIPAPIKTMKYEFIEPEDDPSGIVTRRDLDRLKEEILAAVAQKGEMK